jgi:hypothetical protein
MAIQLTWLNPSAANGYSAAYIGDGVSTSVSIDFFDQIAADKTIRNKNPTGIWQATSSSSGTLTTSISGTTVTFTWSTPPTANVLGDLGVYLTFNP